MHMGRQESVHIGGLKWRVLLYEMHSIVNGTWSLPFFCFVSPTMIKGLATAYELASMKRADLTDGQAFSNALHEGFLTSCSCGIFWCLFVLPSVH